MLNFRSFLKESTLLSEELLLEANHTKDVENDDKGKMHELLLAKYLHPDSTLPEHHPQSPRTKTTLVHQLKFTTV